MKNNIYFRQINSSDYNSIEKIISDTWGYERFCTPKIAKRMAKLYLASCLANQTFTCVAVNNGKPVGIIMGKNEKKHHAPIRYLVMQFLGVTAMISTKEGRRISKLFQGFQELDKELLAKSGKNFDGELAFFAVRSDQRGTGIGKKLFIRLLAYMKSQNIKNFYLYTDSTCNYGFYEHQGMKRINEKIYNLKHYSKKDLLFFLYEYNMKQQGKIIKCL